MAEMMKFAEKLKKLRIDRGMSQADLAKKIGVTPQTISAYEMGGGAKGKNPTLEKVIDIADVFGVSIDDLCGRKCMESHREKNLGDIARLLCEMRGWRTVTFSEVTVRRDAEDGVREYDDKTPAIISDQGALREFLEAYTKLWQLRRDKTIDERMFNDWISMKIGALDNISTATQTFLGVDLDDNDDLPF